ncbi:voltage-gated purine nucleotide uniporter SLC17A9-like [Tubulanus polymorphus]|uniref:voltage-gated purine nucleotide uniporter SLC17A9-like n=1 Tax=Tubulanus polymorphus TaxID=672921 RepID=UPI003DA36A8F
MLAEVDLGKKPLTRSTSRASTWNRQERRLWLGVLFVGCTAVYAARTTMPLCIVSIAEEMKWDKIQSGFVLSAFFWGYTMTQLLGGWLSDRIGGDIVMAFCAAGWAGATFLTPYVPYLVQNPTYVMYIFALSRVIIGACQGVHYPSLTSLLTKRVQPSERSSSYSFTSTGSNMGTLLSGSIGSLLLEYYGWRIMFYFIGIFGIMWVIFMKTTMLPRQKLLRENDTNDVNIRQKPALPWCKLLSSPAFWSIVIGHMCETNCFFILLSWLPTYFHDTFPEAKGWVFNVVPWLVSIPCSISSGLIADKLIAKGYSVGRVRKLMECIALLGSALSLVLISWSDNYLVSVCCMAVAIGCIAFHHAGILVNPQDIAPDHAGSVFGVMNTAGAIPGFVGVYIAGNILEATKSWSAVFNMTSAVTTLGFLTFMIFGTGERIV